MGVVCGYNKERGRVRRRVGRGSKREKKLGEQYPSRSFPILGATLFFPALPALPASTRNPPQRNTAVTPRLLCL